MTESMQPRIVGPTTEEVSRMLIILRSASLRFTPTIDDTMIAEWTRQLSAFAPDDLIIAANTWTHENEEWPSISGMLDYAERATRHRTSEQRGMAHRIPGQVCPRCDDTGFEDGPIQNGYTTVRPCSICRIERRAAHDDGCDMRAHVNAGGCPRCNPSGKRARSKARS